MALSLAINKALHFCLITPSLLLSERDIWGKQYSVNLYRIAYLFIMRSSYRPVRQSVPYGLLELENKKVEKSVWY